MARKTEELIVTNYNVELTSDHLTEVTVPVNYYAEKGAEAVTYHVTVVFADFKDMKRRAIEKVKHTVGHAIRENKINPDFDADGNELPRTVVDSTGYPPKTVEQDLAAIAAKVKAPNKTDEQKAALKKMLMALVADLDSKPVPTADEVVKDLALARTGKKGK